jgi:hypothetical protein
MCCHQVKFTCCTVPISILQINAAGFCDTKQHGVTSQRTITLILNGHILMSCTFSFFDFVLFCHVWLPFCNSHKQTKKKYMCLIKSPYNRHMFSKEGHFKKWDQIGSNHLQHMCKIVSSSLGCNICLILLWIYVCVFVRLIMKNMLHNSQFFQSAFSLFSLSFFSNFFLATKVQTLVDFNDVPSEEKLPLVCEICVFIASL